jgi:hypothetical protein
MARVMEIRRVYSSGTPRAIYGLRWVRQFPHSDEVKKRRRRRCGLTSRQQVRYPTTIDLKADNVSSVDFISGRDVEVGI